MNTNYEKQDSNSHSHLIICGALLVLIFGALHQRTLPQVIPSASHAAAPIK